MKNRSPRLGKFPLFLGTDDAGQALVELALTVPILLLLLLGVAALARVAYVVIEVSNAAEAAVRYGAQNTTTAAPQNWPAIQAAAEADASNISLNTPTVSTSCGCSDGSVSGQSCSSFTVSDCPVSSIVTTLTVTTSTTLHSPIHLPGLPKSFTLYGHAVQKVLY